VPCQKHFYKAFLQELYPDACVKLIERRLSQTYARHCNPLQLIDWTVPQKFLRKSSQFGAMVFFKTVCNSWTCSARYHDGRLASCAFGCTAERGSLEHYLACQGLWGLVHRASAHFVSDNVLQRLCIIEPSPNHLNNLIIAYTVYHSLKSSRLQLLCDAVATGNFDHVQGVGMDIARAAAERQ